MGQPTDKLIGGTAITLADGVTALADPPVNFAYVGDAWDFAGKGVQSQFDLEMKAVSANAVTVAELRGGVLEDFAIAADDVDTVDFANNELDITTHGLLSGDGPIQFTTTDTLPDGISLLTDYYVIYNAAGTIQIATTLQNALAGTAVAFTDVGAGTHTLTGVSSQRMWLHSHGLLGQEGDGAITLTTSRAYVQRLAHRPVVVAYAVVATFGSAVATDVILKPVQAR